MESGTAGTTTIRSRTGRTRWNRSAVTFVPCTMAFTAMGAAFKISAGRDAAVANAGTTKPKGTHTVQARSALARGPRSTA